MFYTSTTVEGGELGRWCELGQNFSDSSPLLLLVVHCDLAIACYCLFNDNRNGDDSLDFVPIHTRCPNSPPSTVLYYLIVEYN